MPLSLLSPQTSGHWSLLYIKGISGHAPGCPTTDLHAFKNWHVLNDLGVLHNAWHIVVHAEEGKGDDVGVRPTLYKEHCLSSSSCRQYEAGRYTATSEGSGAVCPGHIQGRG